MSQARSPRFSSPGEDGFTLFEVLVVLSALSVVLAATAALVVSSADLTQGKSRALDLERRGNSALDSIVTELRAADSTTVLITTVNGADRIRFQVPRRDPGGGPPLLSDPIEIRTEPSLIDADGDGVADDARLVLDTGAALRVLCDFVETGGLTFVRDGDNVLITIALLSHDGQGRVVRSRLETSVALRNG